MQVTEISKENLYREYKVVVAAAEIAEQIDARFNEISKTAQMPGFRKGKVPLHVIKKRHAAEVMGNILQDTVTKTSQELYTEQKIHPATQPDIKISRFSEGEDLEYTVSLEVFPDVVMPDFAQVKLEKLVPDISDEDIEEGIVRLAGFYKNFAAPATPKEAALGDVVVIDYEGSVDGVPFDGGKSDGFRLEIGSGQFIEGFEEQLIGSKANDKRIVNVTFPAQYHHTPLAGKAAVFAVTVNEVLESSLPEINEEFVKRFNLDSVDALKEALKEQIAKDCESVSRTKIKKELFDALETLCTFSVPKQMVETEFNVLWDSASKSEGELDATKSEEEQKEEYRNIAERRVKLGILMAEISKANNLTVEQAEIQQAVFAQTRSYPGQEHAVIDFYRKNPAALEQLKGPILEDKAVDFILDKATITEKKAAVKDITHALDAVES